MTPAEQADQRLRELFARRPAQPQRHLGRIAALCGALGDPQKALAAISVTGTNGKTSVTRMVAGLLQAHGLAVGAFTSPHLQDVCERIAVDGTPVALAALLDVLAELDPHVEAVEARHGEMMTFFEVLTAAACRLFAAAKVDAAVFEVGRGGRVDATNVIDGRVAVINTVALEHPELGATVAAVAAEKAGIIRPGAVVVSAQQPAEAAEVLARAAADRGASLLREGREFRVSVRSASCGGQDLMLQTPAGHRLLVRLALRGAHQAANAACALVAVEAFLGPEALDAASVSAAFAQVRTPGRLEVVRRPGLPAVVLDGAHNPAAGRALAAALVADFSEGRRIVVVGVSDDKDVEGFLNEILPAADTVVATVAPGARAASLERLAAAAAEHGRSVALGGDVADALDIAARMADDGDVVVVTGSLYTVGAARELLGAADGTAPGGLASRVMYP